MRCGGPDMMRKTGNRLVFHLAIIHENEYLVVKILLCPLHPRMRCSESTFFCNKRGFMWVFVRAVSSRVRDAPRCCSLAAFSLTPADVFRVQPDDTDTPSPTPVWGGPGMWLAICAAFAGAAPLAFPGSSARIA